MVLKNNKSKMENKKIDSQVEVIGPDASEVTEFKTMENIEVPGLDIESNLDLSSELKRLNICLTSFKLDNEVFILIYLSFNRSSFSVKSSLFKRYTSCSSWYETKESKLLPTSTSK